MADLTPSRIEPLGGSPENSSDNPNRKPHAKPKAIERTPAPPPPIDDEDKSEQHQLDEQA